MNHLKYIYTTYMPHTIISTTYMPHTIIYTTNIPHNTTHLHHRVNESPQIHIYYIYTTYMPHTIIAHNTAHLRHRVTIMWYICSIYDMTNIHTYPRTDPSHNTTHLHHRVVFINTLQEHTASRSYDIICVI